jgi:hypothetical protein
MAPQKASPAVTDLATWLARLQEAGFTVQEQADGRSLVSKHGGAAVLEKAPSGEPRFAAPPGLLLGSTVACLVDRGFQKFWQDGSRRLPAIAGQLKALHHFDQDLRAVMGMTSLYNEALGTVSARYLYDRLEGREEPKRHKPFG